MASEPREYRVSPEAVKQLLNTLSEPGAAPRVCVDWVNMWAAQCLVPVYPKGGRGKTKKAEPSGDAVHKTGTNPKAEATAPGSERGTGTPDGA